MYESRCGLLCSECENRELCDCPGCLELEEGNWAGDCDIKHCCENRRLEHCGLCPKFPCTMLRNTAFDPDEGDDGERLVTLKRWAEEKDRPIERSRLCIIIGAASGIAAGAILGALSGSFVAVMFACILTGTAIGVIIDIHKQG